MYRRNHLGYRFLDAFFRSWKLFTFVLLCLVFVVGTALYLRENNYTASSMIRVTGQTDDALTAMGGFGQPNWMSSADVHVARFSDLMRDQLPGGFIDTVLKDANLKRPVSLRAEDRDPRFGKFQGAVFAAPQSRDVFLIGIVWDDREEAQRLVESLQRQFIKTISEQNQLSTLKVQSFNDNEIKLVKERMEKKESMITRFKRENMGFLPTALETQFTRLESLEADKSLQLTTAADVSTQRGALLQRLARVPQTIVVKSTITNETPNAGDIRELEKQRRQMIRSGYRPDSTDVKQLDKDIAVLKKEDADFMKKTKGVSASEEVRNPEYDDIQARLAQLEGEERQHTARLANIEQQLTFVKGQISKMPAAERILNDQMRDYEILHNLLNGLLMEKEGMRRKMEIAKITAESTLRPLREILGETTMSTKRRLMILAISLGLGTFVATLVVLLREWADQSFRYEPDTERLLGVPVLISLPDVQSSTVLAGPTAWQVTSSERPPIGSGAS